MNILKSTIRFGVLATTVYLCSACDALDLSPIDYYGSSNYWTKPEHIIGYMDGLHKNLRDKTYQHQFIFGEVRGGSNVETLAIDGTSVSDQGLKLQKLSAVTSGVSKWGELYGLIANINIFLQNTKEATYMSDADKAYYLGQAYGLRAFHYFDLYRTYGTAPLQLDPNKVVNGNFNPEDLYEGRASGSAMMAQIKSDLEESLKYFGDNNSFDPSNRSNKKAYWSKAATECLMGEVYLWNAKVSTDDNQANEADLAIAKNHLLNVVNNYGLSLQEDFTNVFSSTNKGNSEIIMAVRYTEGEAANSYTSFMYNYQTGQFKTIGYNSEDGVLMGDTLQVGTTAQQRHEFKKEMFLKYDKADSRRDATFLAAYYQVSDEHPNGELAGTFFFFFLGHFNVSTNQYVWDADAVIYRLPLVYLMLAEIENMQNGDVAKYINMIRERAYGNNWDISKYGYVNADFTTNELAILNEKDKEFVGEGQRWWDVRRMTLTKGGKHLVFCKEGSIGTTEPILSEAESYKVLWPIETEMLNKDPKLVQTPGYE